MTEFALAAPLMMTAGLYGLEMTNLAITHMRISQAAMHIADNASRIGDTSTITNRKIYEADINDLLLGADHQAGESINIYEYGRVIVSSLETDPDDPDGTQQWIHWQRCKGKKNHTSSYGDEGAGKGDPSFTGMGPAGTEVIALEGEAVIFVEVVYDYRHIVTDAFISNDTISAISSFTVRDDRDLSQIYQADPTAPDQASDCDTFDSFDPTPTMSPAAATESGSSGWNWNWFKSSQ